MRVLALLLTTLAIAVSTTATAAPQAADVRVRAEQARQAMAANRFEEAAALYREILGQVPNEPGIMMNLGMALSMSGRPQEAIDPLSRALKLRPALLPAALFLGQSYLEIDRPADAIAPLQHYVTAQPADLQARQLLASAMMMAGRHRDASAEFRRVTQRAPADGKGWYGLVQSYDALAQEALEALQKTPEGARYEPLLAADALESEGKHEQAFALYKQSLGTLSPEMQPALRVAHEGVARIYTKTGHADWAAQQRAKAKAIALTCGGASTRGASTGAGSAGAASTGGGTTGGRATGGGATGGGATSGGATGASPSKPVAGKASGVTPECEFRGGRYLGVISALAARTDAEAQFWRTRAYAELATGAFDKLTALPPSQELHELRAELYRNQRRHLQSVQELKAALGFSPNDPRLRRELAKSLYFARDWDAARNILDALMKEGPPDPELHFFYGDILLQSQQAEAAIPHLKAAVDGAPDMPTGHAALGRALVQVGRFAEAIPQLEAVLAEDEDGSVHYQLARAYQATGQPDRAKPLLEKYQELQRATQPQPAETAPPAITPPA